jgi:hypothetical protein
MQSQGFDLMALLPMLLIQIPIGIITLLLARLKGKGLGLKILGFVPIVGYFPWMYLVGLTDKRVLDQLSRIETILQASEPSDLPKG